ncbi:hypothetical protein PG996_016126 [Apiospora saccharicola]|uniref:Uncharacterized protein n=1 Tax=Apiospora saccharicola TaxID=335842 RepID=A0ABR1TN88_9PEZI
MKVDAKLIYGTPTIWRDSILGAGPDDSGIYRATSPGTLHGSIGRDWAKWGGGGTGGWYQRHQGTRDLEIVVRLPGRVWSLESSARLRDRAFTGHMVSEP